MLVASAVPILERAPIDAAVRTLLEEPEKQIALRRAHLHARRGEAAEESGAMDERRDGIYIVKDVRGSESNCEQDSRTM